MLQEDEEGLVGGGHKRGRESNTLHIQSKLISIGVLIEIQPLTRETDMYDPTKSLCI